MNSTTVTRLLLVVLATYVTGCANVNPYYDEKRAHRTERGFTNTDGVTIKKPLSDVLAWQMHRTLNSLPPKPQTPTPQVVADLTFIHANAKAVQSMVPAVTWIGHASTLVQASGLNVLTDPIFSEYAGPVKYVAPRRTQAPGLALAQLPKIDVVLISHNHYDHLDAPSILELNQQVGGPPLFLVPLGIKEWMNDLGVTTVREMDWWHTYRVNEVIFMMTPVRHWSARNGNDFNQSLWGGWAVMGTTFHWYFSGDTAYSNDFTSTKNRVNTLQTREQGGGFDLALIGIGAYEPRWFMSEQHVNPSEAIKIHQDLGAKRSIGVHWGTFNLSDEALDQPPRDLVEASDAAGMGKDEFSVMAIGETRQFPIRIQASASPSVAIGNDANVTLSP